MALLYIYQVSHVVPPSGSGLTGWYEVIFSWDDLSQLPQDPALSVEDGLHDAIRRPRKYVIPESYITGTDSATKTSQLVDNLTVSFGTGWTNSSDSSFQLGAHIVS